MFLEIALFSLKHFSSAGGKSKSHSVRISNTTFRAKPSVQISVYKKLTNLELLVCVTYICIKILCCKRHENTEMWKTSVEQKFLYTEKHG